MGLFISRFRKKKNVEEQLDDLTQKIKKIEEFQECEEDKLRLRVRQLVVYSAIIYTFILCVYFILDPESGKKYILLTLIAFPIFIYLFRRLIIYYYKRKIVRNKMKIEVYKKDKQKILDDVMETETYKVAKRILEKYDVTYNTKKFTPPRVSTPIPIPKVTPGATTPYQLSSMSTDLRRRVSRDVFFNQNNQLMSAKREPPTLVRPIITQNKGMFDRIIQKVVGDGPNERYALICRGCGNHNGMALQEEFEFLSYRCAFCSYFNPARKQRAVQKVLNLMAIENASDSDSSCERQPVEITELVDSENEAKEDNVPEKTVKETVEDIVDKVVVTEIPLSIKSTENVEEKTASTIDTKRQHCKETDEIVQTDLSNDVEVTESENNGANEDLRQSVHHHPEDNKKEVDDKVSSDNKSAIVTGQVSPMEVDEDENPGVEITSCVNEISLDS